MVQVTTDLSQEANIFVRQYMLDNNIIDKRIAINLIIESLIKDN
jgi:hypothetical protein